MRMRVGVCEGADLPSNLRVGRPLAPLHRTQKAKPPYRALTTCCSTYFGAEPVPGVTGRQRQLHQDRPTSAPKISPLLHQDRPQAAAPWLSCQCGSNKRTSVTLSYSATRRMMCETTCSCA